MRKRTLATLILLRHGESQWNLENRFTGWWDVNLTEQGEAQARQAGQLMREATLPDRAFTSVLTRAVRTLWLALSEADRVWIPVEKHWRLNERHYGGLTGLNKAETAAKHGEEQVRVWRRSYDIPPPPIERASAYDVSADARYQGLAASDLPLTESLATTLERVIPYWEGVIAPAIGQGGCTLIAAHGNSLRAIVKLLFEVSDEAITDVEIPTGNPLAIELDDALRPISATYLNGARATALPALPG